MSTVKLAAAQFTSVFLDRKATTEKACRIIAEAGKKKVNLLVFPEAFIPTYPEWVWCNPPGKKPLTNQVFEDLWQNAVTIPDSTTRKLCEAAKKARVHVVMGVNERNAEASNATLYNTIIYIDDKGNLLGKHRKLVPTMAERLVWGSGDGSTLNAFDTSLGKIGGLICWENYMPLARYTMYAAGVQFYVAPTWDWGDVWMATLRHIAKEGGAFVIGCSMPMRVADIPAKYEFKKLYDSTKDWLNPGDSCIINPSGNIIAGPAHEKEELLVADADLSMIRHTKWMLDTAGHYDRTDVFRFSVNRGDNPTKG